MKVLVKDVKAFIKFEKVVAAEKKGSVLFVKLHASQNMKRYVVDSAREGVKEFLKLGEAVKYFNRIDEI